jgi:hypothetical protein
VKGQLVISLASVLKILSNKGLWFVAVEFLGVLSVAMQDHMYESLDRLADELEAGVNRYA